MILEEREFLCSKYKALTTSNSLYRTKLVDISKYLSLVRKPSRKIIGSFACSLVPVLKLDELLLVSELILIFIKTWTYYP